MGFTFDDTDTKGVASPITRARADELGRSGERPISMEELIENDPRNQERIFPYIGGKKVNDNPTQAYVRYIINFGQSSLEDARRWPDLIKLIEEKVKPERMRQNDRGAKEKWWQFIRPRPELYEGIRGFERVLLCGQTSKYRSFIFLPNGIVYDQKIIVFAPGTHSQFAVMQSRPHVFWAEFMGSSMKDDPVYTPSDCFETFPFPANWETDAALESIGRTYYDYRAKLMVESNKGLTKTYNRFHDPKERSAEIEELRRLHGEMDRAVLARYGWDDVETTCGFDLDWCDAEAADDASPETVERLESGDYFFPTAADALLFASELIGNGKGLPWRYRWPPHVRDDLLARLLLLNARRAEAERLAGLSAFADEDDDDLLDTEKFTDDDDSDDDDA